MLAELDYISVFFGEVEIGQRFIYNGSIHTKSSQNRASVSYETIEHPLLFDKNILVGIPVVREHKDSVITDEPKIGDTVFAIQYEDEYIDVTCRHCHGKRGGGGCRLCSNGKTRIFYSEGHPVPAILISITRTTNTTGTQTSYQILKDSSIRTAFYKDKNKKVQSQIFKTEHECKLASDADNIDERDKHIQRYMDGTDD